MLRAAILVVLFSTCGSAASAAPDFSASVLTAEPSAPLEGDLVTFTVVVRNTGDQDSPLTQVTVTLPVEGFHIDLTGLADAAFDREQRAYQGTLSVPAGGERRVTFRILTTRDSGGRRLSPTVKLSNLYLKAADYYLHGETTIDARVGSSGLSLGGIRIAPTGLALIIVLLLYPLLRVLVPGAGQGAAIAIVIAVGFWAMFAAMVQRDWRSLTAWRETTCTIRDSRLREDTSSSTRRDTTGTSRRVTTSNTATYETRLALEYTADDRPMLSSGFDTGSRLTIGGFGGAIEEYSRWPIDGTVPCWFDPDHPEDVVVIRGFGGAYFFALFPLPLFIYGLWAMARSRTARSH